MHARIEKLLKLNQQMQVQYVFSSFSKELEVSAQFLIAVYQQKSANEREHIYSEWFEKWKFDKERFFKKYPVNIKDVAVVDEFNRHKEWIKTSQLRATPTILVNGFKLPDNYQIEDLNFFTDLEFEI